MCNLYQATFANLFEDILHGVDLCDLSGRTFWTLHRDSPAYQQYVSRVLNDAVMQSVLAAPRGRRESPPSIIPQHIRAQVPRIRGKELCVRFKAAKGCTFDKCNHVHEPHRLPEEVLTWLTGMHGGLKTVHPQRE
ncbi:Hypothetical protein PHPALM_14601 [Phytophthora palmivora]|uniref:C3H1-type domain-containing protein n=1 Tax=Phytophthora palmivora TaxID=4796 RepID=A0A2P4XU92_9STRA|nr:Hypothetical protein PHPALM_14601 [Phytophthora palmivora]